MTDPEPPRLEGVHVLVVDDNEDARYVLDSYLTHVGATVTTARSGGEALGVLGEVQAHVIVSDLSMPGFSGHDFIRRVRELPGQADRPTPAIAVTASDDRESRQRAMASGFQVYLVKPIDPVTVAQEIERLYRESRPQ